MQDTNPKKTAGVAAIRFPRTSLGEVISAVADDQVAPDTCVLPLSVAARVFAPLVLLLCGRRNRFAPALVRAAVVRVLAGRLVLVRRAGKDGFPVALRPCLASEVEQEGCVRLHPLVATLCADGAAMDLVVVRGLFGERATKAAARLTPAYLLALHNPPRMAAGKTWLEPRARLGLVLLTNEGEPCSRLFSGLEQVVSVWQHGELPHDQVVTVRLNGKRVQTTPGRAYLFLELAAGLAFEWVNCPLHEFALGKLIQHLSLSLNDPILAHTKLHRIGVSFAERSGFSFSMDDLSARTPPIHLASAEALGTIRAHYDEGLCTDGERFNKEMDLFSAELIAREEMPRSPSLSTALAAGLVVDKRAVRQLVDSIGIVTQASGSLCARPILGAPGRGLDSYDLMIRTLSLRAAYLRRPLPGPLLRKAVERLRDLSITIEDCGAPRPEWIEAVSCEGVLLRSVAQRAYGRVLEADLVDGQGVRILDAGTLLCRKAMAVLIEKAGSIQGVLVRTPRTCGELVGVCAKCYGLDLESEFKGQGRLVALGTRVGLQSVLALSLAMRGLPRSSYYHIC